MEATGCSAHLSPSSVQVQAVVVFSMCQVFCLLFKETFTLFVFLCSTYKVQYTVLTALAGLKGIGWAAYVIVTCWAFIVFARNGCSWSEMLRYLFVIFQPICLGGKMVFSALALYFWEGTNQTFDLKVYSCFEWWADRGKNLMTWRIILANTPSSPSPENSCTITWSGVVGWPTSSYIL